MNTKLRLTDCELIIDMLPLVAKRLFSSSKIVLYCLIVGSFTLNIYPDNLFHNLMRLLLIAIAFVPEVYHGSVSFCGKLKKEDCTIFLVLPFFGQIEVKRPSLLYIESERTYYLVRKGFFSPIVVHPFLFQDDFNLKMFIKRLRDFMPFEREVVSPMLVSFYQNNYTEIKREK